jgi:hypothetical protein
MKDTIKQELLSHVIDTINDQELTEFEELHFHAFNEDHYIIGYYNAEQWLERHGVTAWEAIGAVLDWEAEVFGETHSTSDDVKSETIVNKYVYLLGEELLSEFDLDQSSEKLLADIQKIQGGTL